MERITRLRVRIVLIAFALIVLFFAFKLYDLQIIQTGGKTDNSSTLPPVSASRPPVAIFWTGTVIFWWVTVPVMT